MLQSRLNQNDDDENDDDDSIGLPPSRSWNTPAWLRFVCTGQQTIIFTIVHASQFSRRRRLPYRLSFYKCLVRKLRCFRPLKQLRTTYVCLLVRTRCIHSAVYSTTVCPVCLDVLHISYGVRSEVYEFPAQECKKGDKLKRQFLFFYIIIFYFNKFPETN